MKIINVLCSWSQAIMNGQIFGRESLVLKENSVTGMKLFKVEDTKCRIHKRLVFCVFPQCCVVFEGQIF